MCHRPERDDASAPEQLPAPTMRASDVDRDRVVAMLHGGASEGRLESEELEQRVGAALRARTLGELEALTQDLPAARTPRRPRGRSAHRAVYLRVAVLLIAIWALTGFGPFWPAWPLVGWGVFLLAAPRSRRLA